MSEEALMVSSGWHFTYVSKIRTFCFCDGIYEWRGPQGPTGLGGGLQPEEDTILCCRDHSSRQQVSRRIHIGADITTAFSQGSYAASYRLHHKMQHKPPPNVHQIHCKSKFQVLKHSELYLNFDPKYGGLFSHPKYLPSLPHCGWP